jgi:hypothetical protein
MRSFILIVLSGALFLASLHAQLPGTDPIAIPESGLLEKDHQNLRLRWANERLLPEAEKRWKGKPWSDQARIVTAAGFQLWLAGRVPEEAALKSMIGKVEALLKAGCEEPLACWMAHKVLFFPDRDWRVSNRSLTHALKIVNDTAYSGALRSWIIDERIDLLKLHERSVLDSFQDEQAVRIAAAVKDPAYSGAFEAVLVRDFFDWMNNTKDLSEPSFVLLKKSIEEASLSEWVKQTLLTELELDWAWRIRGGKWAHMVQQDAWKGFTEHLGMAAKHGQKAWEHKPDRPEAAAKMLSITMGLGGTPVQLREWFDRVVKAQFDYLPAYNSLAYACSARWGGSDQLVLALGQRFAETKRYDTDVPAQLFYACKRIAVEQANARMVFSHPSVKSTFVEFAQKTLEYNEPDAGRAHRQRSLAAISAWLAGDDMLAAQGLKAIGGKIDRQSRQELADMMHHVDGMKISVAAGSGEWGEPMKALEQHHRRNDLKKIKEALEALDEATLKSEAAKTYLAELRALHEFPAKLEKGGWHPLPVYPGLATCLSTDGEWRVTAPGEITFSGADVYQADLVFPLLAGDYFEIRGEVALRMPPDKDWLYNWVFSPVLRWQPDRFSFPAVASGVRGVLYQNPGSPPKMAVAGKYYTKRIGEQYATLKPSNTFHLKVDGQKVEYAFNGVSMPPQQVSDLKLEAPRGLVALAGIYVPFGGKLVITKLEARTQK